MPIITGSAFTAEIEWWPDNAPVLVLKGHGRLNQAREAIDVIREVIRLEEASEHKHICVVYDLLDVAQLPFMGRFITSGQFPTTERTAHLIIATHNQAIRLVGTLSAVAIAKRLRTVQMCDSPAEIEAAVNSWLLLPERTREYQIDDI